MRFRFPTSRPAFLHSRSGRRALGWAVGLFAAFNLLVFLVLPPLARSFLEKQLGEALHRPVDIRALSFNPYALSAEIAGLSVHSAEGREVAGFERLYLNLEAASLWRGGPVLRAVQLEHPRLRVARLDSNRYDISDLLDEWSRPSDSPPLRFALGNIEVSGGRLLFEDRPAGLTHTVADLALRLPFLSSLPHYAEIEVQPHFSATVDGAPLLLSGHGKPFSATHESELSLRLERLDLVRFLPYLPVRLPLSLRSGRLDSDLRFLFRQAAGKPATLRLTGSVQVKDFAAHESGGQPLVAWKELDLSLREGDLLQRRIALGKVRLTGLENHLRLGPEGKLNWLDLLAALAGPESGKKTPESSPPLIWSVDEIQVEDGTQHWRDLSRDEAFAATLRNLRLTARHLDSRFTKPVEVEAAWSLDAGPGGRIKRGEVKGARIDVAKRHANLGEVSLTAPEVALRRDPAGRFDLPFLPRPPASGKAPGPCPESQYPCASPEGSPRRREGAEKTAKAALPATAEAPWTLAADRLVLSAGVLRYEDESLPVKSAQAIEGLEMTLEHFSTAPGRQAELSLKARVNGQGSLKVGGQVQLQPLAARLDLDINAFPLLPLQPYFAERLNLILTRGQLSGQGSLALEETAEGLGGGFKGQMTIGDLHSIDRISRADFLQWKSFFIGDIDARFQPFSLTVGQAALSDFYARVRVNPEGQLNLLHLLRPPASPEQPTPRTAALPIRVDQVSFQGGTVNFSDYFVKPNYTVNVTRLAGRVSGLSSAPGTAADLELRGSYGNAAPVQVLAKLNPLSARAYLDLKGEIRGVDLTSLSAYSGKYAGYAIEKGKLSLYVTYHLDHNQLSADNRLFLDQLAFGDRVESPTATSLPVKLAVALLKNSRGEIDLNLPISGSIDDPQFSLGGVILRVIRNLFVKAVASPFALLGSLFGGGEDLSGIEFTAGRATLAPAAIQKLESLARAMRERPALKLEIAGLATPESDREGLKRATVEDTVKAEKRKDPARRGAGERPAEALEVEPGEYAAYLQRAYREAKFPKPRNFIGLPRDLPVAEMERLMLANVPVGEEDLRQLAARRAEATQAWLVERGQVPPERLFLLPPRPQAESRTGGVEFSLR